jgi:hypothetical protein
MNEPEQQRLPEVAEVLMGTTASLVNLAGIRLTEEGHVDPVQAKQAIDAARALLPLCPEEAVGPIKDALAQLQMIYVKQYGGAAGAEAEAPGAAAPGAAAPEADDAARRAEARAKIWTPPGS